MLMMTHSNLSRFFSSPWGSLLASEEGTRVACHVMTVHAWVATLNFKRFFLGMSFFLGNLYNLKIFCPHFDSEGISS